MKKTNIQKIILVLIPVLFIFSGIQNSKADTYCIRDERTNGVGGGYAWIDYKQWCSTITTDKPTYNVGESISYLINTVYDEYFCGERNNQDNTGFDLVCTYYPPEPATYTGTNFSMKNSSNTTTTSIAGTYPFAAGGNTPLSWLIPNNYVAGNYSLILTDYITGQWYPQPASYYDISIPVTITNSCPSGGSNQLVIDYTEYLNNTGSDLTGINYTDDSNNYRSNVTVSPNQSIFVKTGTGGGGGFGFLTILGTGQNTVTAGNSSCGGPKVFVK